ncbi:type VI secretion system baseplate subunit TssG [Enterobacter asburiae]|uniref:type VI secretion system baseplate subunit TssG n=1 Tax=Scandinavium sp. UTDF21-P1B TaxID=3446379 RepID=UPI003486A86B
MGYKHQPEPIAETGYRNLTGEQIPDTFPGLSNRLDFFELLRRLERDGGLKMRLGSATERQGIDLRVIQPADMTFAPREIAQVEQRRRDSAPPTLIVTCRHFGLFAPYGPLPLYITDYARQERLNRRNRAFEEFVSLLSQRLAVWHYRAWAQLHVALGHEKPGANAFLQHICQLGGLQDKVAENPHVQRLRMRFAGAYLPQRQNLATLKHLLIHYFRLPVHFIPRFARWIDDGEGEQRQRMGRLGKTRIGRRFYDNQHTVKIEIGPLAAPAHYAFQRGGEKLTALLAICRDFTGGQLLFDVDLLIVTESSMSASLGGTRLGRNGWLKAQSGQYRQHVYQQSI